MTCLHTRPPCPNWRKLIRKLPVTNSGCERTAGKIPGRGNVVNRTLAKFERFLDCRPPEDRRVRSKHGDRIDVDGNLDALRRRSFARYDASQQSERLRVRATKLEMESVETADHFDRSRRRAQDPYRGIGCGAEFAGQLVHVCSNARFIASAGDDPHQPAVGWHTERLTNGELDFRQIPRSRDGRPGGLRGARVKKFVRLPVRVDLLFPCGLPLEP